MKQSRGMSAREIRRMMERRERKEENEKRTKQFWALPETERRELIEKNDAVKRILQNGISLQDLSRERMEGYRAGSDNAVMTCYAGICLALHELHGFGKQRIMKVLQAVDETVLYSLTGAEAVKEVFDKLGIELNFNETFPEDRITDKSEAI